jgi:hypothetical protein
MVQERWDVVWERSRAGRHTVVIGPDTLPLAPSDLQVLCVRCDALGTSGGVLDAAQRRVAQRLGEEVPAPEPGRARFEQGLRQRFLGDMPGPSLDARLVEACNRLADQTAGRTVLAFEAIDAADEATIATLAQILQRPGWLRLPLLLTARSTPQGRGAQRWPHRQQKRCAMEQTSSPPTGLPLLTRGACWDCGGRPGEGPVDETPSDCPTPW